MPSSLNQSGQFTDCSSLTAVVHRKHLMADVIRHPDAQKLKELPELMVVQRSLTVLAPPHYNIHYFIHKISIFKDGIQAASACSPRLLETVVTSTSSKPTIFALNVPLVFEGSLGFPALSTAGV